VAWAAEALATAIFFVGAGVGTWWGAGGPFFGGSDDSELVGHERMVRRRCGHQMLIERADGCAR
jgi:hypothetical protein